MSVFAAFLSGHAFASGEGLYSDDFRAFTDWITKHPRNEKTSDSWIGVIENLASDPAFEIPIFFEFLDEYQAVATRLSTVTLTPAQMRFGMAERSFRFNTRAQLEFLPAPARLDLMRNPRVEGVLLLYYDHGQRKFYEQCLKSESYAIGLIRKCYAVDESQWTWFSKRMTKADHC